MSPAYFALTNLWRVPIQISIIIIMKTQNTDELTQHKKNIPLASSFKPKSQMNSPNTR